MPRLGQCALGWLRLTSSWNGPKETAFVTPKFVALRDDKDPRESGQRRLEIRCSWSAFQRAQELDRVRDAGLDNRLHPWREFESEFLHWVKPHVATKRI